MGEIETKKPIDITFRIDIPENTDDSIFNSIILSLANYKQLKGVDFTNGSKYKILNNILLRAQRQIDDLIVIEIEEE